jgi:GMP synthase (glutamine-hydrolysing)
MHRKLIKFQLIFLTPHCLMQHDKILILDFGSQVTQLIARRVREAHVLSEVHPCDVSNEWVREYAKDGSLKGIILSGSHASVYEDTTDKAPQAVFELGIPVLGICYGMQTMAHQLGGKVEGGHKREFGFAPVRAHGHTALLKNIQDFATDEGHGMLNVWMSHGDKVTELPPGFKLMASTDSCPIAGMADEARRFYAVQFHPEVTHTVQGKALLERFVLGICGAKKDWVMRDYIAEAVAKIKAQVGDEEVILGLSGGVDSSVAAALIHRAIGQQLTCVFVDHGLLRLNEGDAVMEMFEGKFGLKVIRADASDLFLGKLAGVSEPEAKRKIIGGLFVDVFKAEAEKLKQKGRLAPVYIDDVAIKNIVNSDDEHRPSRGAKWLAQGTIYPDVIESGGAKSKKAVTIKSHHNVGGLPEQLGLKLLEPLRDLFKDEVRELGVALGLPHAMVYRHPFPGPGLGVRILGEVKKEYADLLRKADAIFIEELRSFKDEATGKNWYDLTSQAFTVFLPVKSVGVMGDGRTYDYVVALRAVQTSDFMTADWAELPYALLKKVSGRIINEVRGINRVTYDVSSKPPATIEWE